MKNNTTMSCVCDSEGDQSESAMEIGFLHQIATLTIANTKQ